MILVITIIFCVVSLLCLVALLDRGVIPRIRRENGVTSSALGWIEVWIPMIAVVPLVLAILLCSMGSPYREPRWAAWWACGPAATVGAILLAVALVPRRTRDAWDRLQSLGMRYSIPLVLLGAILTVASLSDRFGFQQGVIFCVAGVLWLWVATPAHDAQADGRGANKGPRRPVFLIDWAGKLREPVSVRTKILMIFLIGMFGILCAAGLRSSLAIAVMCAVGYQAALGVVMYARLGSSALARFAASATVLSILFGLGTMAVSRLSGRIFVELLDPDMFISWIPIEWYLPGPQQLLGLSSLRAAGVLLVGLGIIALLSEPRDAAHPDDSEFRSGFAALIIVCAALVVGATGSSEFVDAAGRGISRVIVRAFDLQPDAPGESLESP